MKRWCKSKTIWFAVLTGGVGIGTAVIDSGVANETVAGYALIGVAVGNAILRFVTTEPVK